MMKPNKVELDEFYAKLAALEEANRTPETGTVAPEATPIPTTEPTPTPLTASPPKSAAARVLGSIAVYGEDKLLALRVLREDASLDDAATEVLRQRQELVARLQKNDIDRTQFQLIPGNLFTVELYAMLSATQQMWLTADQINSMSDDVQRIVDKDTFVPDWYQRHPGAKERMIEEDQRRKAQARAERTRINKAITAEKTERRRRIEEERKRIISGAQEL
jgi:hypothetical protein